MTKMAVLSAAAGQPAHLAQDQTGRDAGGLPCDILAWMGAKAEELMDEVLALSEDDRREVARELLLKLAIDPDVLEAWHDEAERRWAEIERGEVETLAWDEVRQRVFGAP
jgi:putative addiction module component (TIGR02574 family)